MVDSHELPPRRVQLFVYNGRKRFEPCVCRRGVLLFVCCGGYLFIFPRDWGGDCVRHMAFVGGIVVPVATPRVGTCLLIE